MNVEKQNRSFGWAIEQLKDGNRVCRDGWNGKGMWLELIGSSDYQVEAMSNELLPWIGMKTADNKFVPWLASQTDVLADDWTLVQ